MTGIAALAEAGVGDSLNLAREEHLTKARGVLEGLPAGESRDRLRESVCLVATLFKMLARESLLTSEALTLINRMQLPMVRLFYQEGATLGDPAHPARLLLQELCAALLGVSVQNGAGSEVVYETASEVVHQLYRAELMDRAVLAAALGRLREELAALNRRIDRIEEKVRQSEVGRERNEVAQREVTRALNARMTGTTLPVSVSRFLHGPWRDSLKLVWVRSGEDSKAWTQSLQLTDFLLWAVQPGNAETDSQRFYNGMPLLIKGLTVGLISLSHDALALERALSEVNDDLLKILKKEERQCEPAPLIEEEGGVEGATPEMEATLCQVDALKPGDWMLLKLDNGLQQHCKIAVISKQTQRYIMVNRMGMRVAEKSRIELAAELFTQQAKILGAASAFERVLAQTMASLHDAFVMHEKRRAIERAQQQEKKRALDAELASQRLAQELALARQQAEEDARAQIELEATASQQREADALALQAHLQQARQEASAPEPVVPELPDDFDAEEAANNLNVGGWVELVSSDQVQRCKLAVRIKQTNRYIFVDRIGVKLADLSFDEVVTRLRLSQMRILHSGESFNRALETVVKTNRNDKKPLRNVD